MFIDAMSVGLILPVMPGLIGELSSLSNSEAARVSGELLTVFALMQFVCAPLLGALSDRFGRRNVILIAVFGLGIDYFIMAAAPSIFWLYVARIISGVCGATYAAANSAIVDISDPKERARNFGYAGAAIGIGLIFGPAIGGLLGEYGTRLPFLVAGVLSMLIVTIGFFALPETLPSEKRRAFSIARANPIGGVLSIARSRFVILMLAAMFMIQIASQSYTSVWPFFTIEVAGWSPFEIGISVALYGVLLAIVQGGLTGPAVARFGERRMIVFGIVTGIAVYLGLSTARSASEIYFWVAAGGLTGVTFPSIQALMSKMTSEDAQGELQGAIASSYSLSCVIGPYVMTRIFSHFSGDNFNYPGAPFVLSSGLIIIAGAIFFASLRTAPETKEAL